MKYKMFFASLFFCFFVAFASSALAVHDIVIKPTTDGFAETTEFSCGDTIILSIELDNDAGDAKVAGTAFTITYPDTVVDPPSLGTDGLPTTSTDIQSSFPFTTGSTKTHRAGNQTTGQLALSGAAVDGTTGGATNHADDAQLFTVSFKVKSAATLGNYQFGIMPTTPPANTATGWNGSDSSPVLVGAVPQGDADFDNLSGGAFPELLSTINKTSPFSIVYCPEFTPGDITGDGNIDLNDVRELLYFIRGYPGYEDPGAVGDINKDGNKDLNDVRFLLYHVRGYPGYEVFP